MVTATEKVALVTSAATEIGTAIARRLAADGFRMGLISSTDKGAALARELDGVSVTGSGESLTDLLCLVELAHQRWGRIDVLVNNASRGQGAPLLALSDELWLADAKANLLQVVRPTQLVTPIMQRQGGGVVINISGAAAKADSELAPASSTIRAALESFTRIFVGGYSRANIRMNNILPGWIGSAGVHQNHMASVPLQRLGTPEDIAAAVAFLASEGAAYITGQTLRVDGGLGASSP
ncbi:Putative ketoacyl reductase [Delftia tsuruhatensis]|uniref:SDR family oxidoreductase n=1 Tax=Delftia tsuruhatensis TaxID=180282 RepID=UPI001E6D6560|nr:SDR family oxidoreductase [Delftia tsuruhatensis]CAB5707455.1 Putative ketoacyl reductase [Delftia tsuruhatensis]CAC9684903.1 Putative ketoacyl reductase [Delftia tsuruhatensis]